MLKQEVLPNSIGLSTFYKIFQPWNILLISKIDQTNKLQKKKTDKNSQS